MRAANLTARCDTIREGKDKAIAEQDTGQVRVANLEAEPFLEERDLAIELLDAHTA